MIIKLDSSYGIMRVNSDNITTYFREDNQLLTQLNMTDGKRYLYLLFFFITNTE